MKSIFRKFRKQSAVDYDTHNTMRLFLKGRLSPDEAETFQKRIQESENLRKELQAWDELERLFEDGKTPGQGEEYWELYRKSLAAKLDEGPHAVPVKKSAVIPRVFPGFKLSYVAALAVLIAVFLTTYKIWKPGEAEKQLAYSPDSNWLELCMNEFETVAQQEVIFEPLPQNIKSER